MIHGSNDFVQFKTSSIATKGDKSGVRYLPEKVYVLNNVQPATIQSSGQFRVHGMFPILSYYNKSKNIAIWRSS